MALSKSDLSAINKLIQVNNKRLEKIVDAKIQANNKNLARILEFRMDIKIDNFQDEIFERLQQFKSDILEALDPILKEIRANREERVIISHRLSQLEEKLASQTS